MGSAWQGRVLYYKKSMVRVSIKGDVVMFKFHAAGLAALLSCAVIPFLTGPAIAQLETDTPMYVDCKYGFAIIYPGNSKQPQARDIRYTIPFYANNLPAREFYLEQGGSRYSVTVVDFSTGPRADEQLVETAAAELRKKGEVRFQAFAEYDPGMPGRQLNIFEANGRQLRASLYMAYHRLVITQAEAPSSDVDAIRFEQSIVLVDQNGYDIDRVNGMDGTGSEPLRQWPCANK
jgi:hypothetical protein